MGGVVGGLGSGEGLDGTSMPPWPVFGGRGEGVGLLPCPPAPPLPLPAPLPGAEEPAPEEPGPEEPLPVEPLPAPLAVPPPVPAPGVDFGSLGSTPVPSGTSCVPLR